MADKNGASPVKPQRLSEMEMDEEGDDGEGGVKMKRSIGLFSGVSIIVGCIIGSGIFIAPKGIQEKCGSVGLSLMAWVITGVFCGFGAYCYAELGTLIRKTGGDYAYIMTAFGPFIAFVRLWIEAIVVRPCTATVVVLTFATYLLRPFYPNCDPPSGSLQLVSAITLLLLTAVNCLSVKLATRVQDIFMVAKVFALILIIITGIVLLCTGKVQYRVSFENPMEATNWSFSDMAVGFYSGLFAYQGWNYLNFIVEELQNPKRNLPLAIFISVILCIIIYTLTNIAFYTVVSPAEMLESPAVAIEFANKLYGPMAWIMPVFVSCSTIGSANGVILTSSRLFYAGARENQMPQVLTMVSQEKLTPMPAVILTGLLSLMYLALSDNIYTLINYIQIVYFLAIAVAILALFWLRRTMPDAPRPIKVNLFFPVTFFMGCVFLVVLPVFSAPMDTAIGFVLVATGIPVYFIFVYWENKPAWFNRLVDSFTVGTQKLLDVVGEDKKLK